MTKDELEEAISDLKKEQDTVLRGHESSIQEHSDSLTGLEKAILKSSGSVDSLTGRVEDTENKVLQLSQSIEAMEVSVFVCVDCMCDLIGHTTVEIVSYQILD